MSILCIGEALIDMICTDVGSSLIEGQHFIKKTGGAPTNVAAAIAALGGNVALSAKVGNDPFGKQLIQEMEDFGVDTTYLLTDPTQFTSFAYVSLMKEGERDFVFNRGADGHLSGSDIDNIDLADTSIIHFGSATAFLPGPLQKAYLCLLAIAKEKSIYISFDPNYRHLLFNNRTDSFISQSWNFLQKSHFFKLSDEEALLLTSTKTLESAVEQLTEKTKAVFAITLGKKGTLLGFQKSTYLIPSISIQAIDTTGAGDAFVGALLFQLAEIPSNERFELSQEKWQQIVANANKAGARTCEYLGAMEAFKNLNKQLFD